MQRLEIDHQISEANLQGDVNKRNELFEQKKKLNRERIKLMSENNPRFAQLDHERRINILQRKS